MGYRINTNIASISAQRALKVNSRESESTMAKLSSGSRINKAADDAAGLAISEKLKATMRSSAQAGRNANDGISMIQVAEGSFSEIGNVLTRLRELAIQAASDTVGDSERKFSDMEYQNLIQEVQRISEVTEFNGRKLLDGSGDKYEFQIGIMNNEFQDRISYDAQRTNGTTQALGIEGLTVMTKEGAQSSLNTIDSAIMKVSGNRAELGALQNRLVSTSTNLDVLQENLASANSRIRDMDFAEGAAQNAKNQILSAASTSVLAQANSNGQNALKLLG
jgi:flagellin